MIRPFPPTVRRLCLTCGLREKKPTVLVFWWWCEDRSRSIRRKILDLNFLKRSHSGLGLASPRKKLEHTVDGRNPGPHVMYETVWKTQIFWMSTGTGFLPSPVFNYFFALVSSPKPNHPENSRTRNHAVKSMKKPTFWKTERTLHKPWKKICANGWTIFGALALLAVSKNSVNAPIPSFFLTTWNNITKTRWQNWATPLGEWHGSRWKWAKAMSWPRLCGEGSLFFTKMCWSGPNLDFFEILGLFLQVCFLVPCYLHTLEMSLSLSLFVIFFSNFLRW